MKRINLRLLLGMVAAVVILAGGVVGLHRFQVARNAGGLVKLARQRLKEGRQGDAMALFGRYLGMRPDDVQVQREFAELLLDAAGGAKASRDSLQRAYNSLEEAVRRSPDDDQLRLKLAEFQVRIGRFVDAKEHLETLRSRFGQRAAAGESNEGLDPEKMQMLLARAFAGDGDFDAAARLSGDLVGYDVQQRAFDPERRAIDATDPYILLGTILEERLEDPAAAATVFEELAKRRDKDAETWLALAKWHRRHNEMDKASSDMAKAMELSPEDPDVIFGSFELSLAKGEKADALATVTRARELFPGDERVYRGLAALAMQNNDLAAAESALRDGVAQLPGKASLLLMLADSLLQQRKLDDADEVVTNIEELFGNTNPAVGLLQGRVLVARGRWPQARRRLEEVRPLAVGNGELTRQIDLLLGQCYENLQEFDVQLDVSRRILVDDPGSLVARVTQASAMAAGGRPDEALEEFENVAAAIPAERLPTVPQVWYPLLQLRVLQQMNRPVAERDWSRVDDMMRMLEESPAVSAAQIALLRADLLARKGDNDAATDLLERAAKAPDAEPQIWSALALLTLRERGVEAARAVLARLPADRVNHPAILDVRVQIAARSPPEQAAREFAEIEEEATNLPPENAARLLTTLGSLRAEAGDAAGAERLWRKAGELQPDDLRSRTALLELAMRMGDVEQTKAAAAGIETVAGATSARSRVARAGERILEVRLAQDRKELDTGKIDLSKDEMKLLDEARNLLIEAENDRPGWSLIQTYFAEIDGLKGDIPAAIDRLQRAVRLGPAAPDVVRQLVALLYSSNRLEEARKTLDLLGPDGVTGLERLSAEMELRSGRLDEAVVIAERAVSRDSTNGGELLWLGQLLERSGQRERAGDLFAKAVEVAPDRPDAWTALFTHQLSTGRRRAAETTLGRATERLQSPARELVFAHGSELLGRINDAEQAFREAATAAPTDVGIATARTEFLVRIGRVDVAKQSLRELIEQPADDTPARLAKAWARRKLAELVAERATYSQLREALSLLEQNARPDGRLPVEDAAAKVAILANRPEPASWQQAIKTLETLRDQQPLTTAQRLTLAGLLDKANRWDESRQELMAIVSAPKTPPNFIAMLADKLIGHGEIDNARPWIRRLRDAAPGAPVTLALEARLAIADKDRARAAELAKRLIPTGEQSAIPPAQFAAIAQLLEELDFLPAADQVLAQFAAQSPDGVVARAKFLGRQQRTSEALDVLERAWDSQSLERTLATALEVLQANPKAQDARERIDRWLAKARRIDPDSIVVDLLEAEMLNLLDRGPEAEARYRKLLARDDLEPVQRAIVSNNLAFHLANPQTATEASTLIDEAIATIGPHPDLLDTRGLVLLALGEDRRAVTDFEQASLQPSDLKFLHLAYGLLRCGDKSAARTALEKGWKKGLSGDRLSPADRVRLRELEAALGVASEQAGTETTGGGRG